MRSIRTTTFWTALAAAALLAGCGSAGLGDIYGGGDRTNDRTNGDRTNDSYSTSDVQGTVERVDTLNRRIVVDSETDSRYNLRNGNDSGQIAVYYDDRTTVEYQGQTYDPQDLERGDRIRADVDQTGDRLLAQQIEVLSDASSGSAQGSYDDNTNNDYRTQSPLRGTVRYVDTRSRTLEVEPSAGSRFTTERSSDVVVVYFDAGTTVEYQGRRYQPENLERGDVVEIDLSGPSTRPFAEQIVVVQGR
jgi:hypothetical protein